jgi:hypothetical protein
MGIPLLAAQLVAEAQQAGKLPPQEDPIIR